MRIHSDPAKEPGTAGARQPWIIQGQPRTENLVRDWVNMRYKLIPTLVAAGARVTEGDGMPLVRRLDLEWPEFQEATRDDQYLLGDDLLVAPIDPFANNGSNATGWNRNRTVWLPPADGWVDAFTGQEHTGNQTLNLVNIPLEKMPLYQRKGGLVVLAKPGALSTASQDKNQLVIEAFAPSSDSTVQRKTKRVDGKVENLMFVRDGDELRLTISPAVAPWIVRIRLPHGEILKKSTVDGVQVKPKLLAPTSATSQMPFGPAGSPNVGSTMAEFDLDIGQSEVVLEF